MTYNYRVSSSFLFLKSVCLIVILATLGCGNNINPNIEYQDFDSFHNWSGDNIKISNQASHNGKWSAIIDSSVEYSLTYSISVASLKLRGYKKVNVKSWVMMPSMSTDAKLVLTIDNADNKSISWNGKSFKDVVRNPNEWTEISSDLDLTEAPKSANFKIYGWSSNKGTAYLDDIEITYE